AADRAANERPGNGKSVCEQVRRRFAIRGRTGCPRAVQQIVLTGAWRGHPDTVTADRTCPETVRTASPVLRVEVPPPLVGPGPEHQVPLTIVPTQRGIAPAQR